jgi:hypothetical protein
MGWSRGGAGALAAGALEGVGAALTGGEGAAGVGSIQGIGGGSDGDVGLGAG